MKSTLILIATFLFSCQLIFAQSSLKLDPQEATFIDIAVMECSYKYSIKKVLKDSINKHVEETYTTILQANGSVSKFWDWHSFKLDSLYYSHTGAQLGTDSLKNLQRKNEGAKYFFFPVIVKNYPKGKVTVTDEIYPIVFLYEEAKTEHKWTLKDDTLTVCGYLCYKAVASFGGRQWTAWYAPDITLSDGPWKLYGLPGLILKAQDSTTTHTFEAVAIRQSAHPIYVAKIPLKVKTQKDSFIKNKNRLEGGIDYEVPITEIKSFRLSPSGAMIINGKRSPKNYKQDKTVYNPLELE